MRPSIPLFLTAGVLLAGCAGDSGTPLARLDPAGVSGVWQVTESIAADAFETTCEATSRLLLRQHGAGLEGHYRQEGSCRDRFAEFDNSGEGRIRSGAVHTARARGDVVTWDDGTCAYTGMLAGGSMSGTVRCVLAAGGQKFEFRGRWRARRVPEGAVRTASAAGRGPDACPGAETPAFYGRIPVRDRSSRSATRT